MEAPNNGVSKDKEVFFNERVVEKVMPGKRVLDWGNWTGEIGVNEGLVHTQTFNEPLQLVPVDVHHLIRYRVACSLDGLNERCA